MFKSDDSKLPALYAALAKARAAFEALKPNQVAKITHKSGGQHSFTYTDLGAINEATVKALSANGLVVCQPIGEAEDGILYLWTGLMHSDGATLVVKTALPRPEQFDDVKKFGAHVTYMRRYIKTGLLDLSGEEDLDSNGIPPGEGEKVGAAEPRQAPTLPPYTQDIMQTDLPALTQMVKSGKKTPEGIIAFLSTKYTLNDAQRATILQINTTTAVAA